MRFVDTNILLYAVSKAADERRKTEIALALLEANDLALSVQVLQEFYVQATHARKRDPLTHAQATLLIEAWLRFPVEEMSLNLLHAALDATERFRLAYWDAAIIEAARSMGCDVVLSEDLSDGQMFGGVSVVNPFHRGRSS